MKRAHTTAKKANRGKRGDTPMKGLKLSERKTVEVFEGFRKRIKQVPVHILNHTLVQPRGSKVAFLRRNELIKKD